MPKADALADRLTQLEAEYRSLLVGALRECAAGYWGLFGHNEHLSPRAKAPKVVEELADLAHVIDSVRLRLGQEPFPLHEQFQASRGRAGANSVGEPKQAQAWLVALGEH